MTGKKLTAGSALKLLSERSRTYDAAASIDKIHALKTLSKIRKFKPSELVDYHRLLLFLAAFPDSAEVHALTCAELKRLPDLARAVLRAYGDRALLDSGIAGSQVEINLGLAALHWIHRRDPSALRVEDYRELGRNDELQDLLRDLVDSPISDGILNLNYTNAELFKQWSPKNSPAWLLSNFFSAGEGNPFAEHCFERLNLKANWRLNTETSLTGARFPARKIVYGRAASGAVADLRRHLARPLKSAAKLSRAELSRLIDVCRAVLYQQGRATDSVDYASAEDSRLFQLDSGVDVFLIGTMPGRRRYLESFVGFMAAKNGRPCAYGGAWILAGRADIGINIFDWLRGGESSLIFAEVLRVYRQAFEVEPYQFGDGNEEGLASGAFWFYWKLGFRSVKAALNRLAERERRRAAHSKRRSHSRKVMTRLLEAKLRFNCRGPGARRSTNLSVQSLGVMTMKHLRQKYGSDLQRARRECSARLKQLLRVGSQSGWTAAEREAFARLSLMMDAVPRLEKWPRADLQKLKLLMRAKGAASEAKYIKSFGAHRRLMAELGKLKPTA